MTLENEISPGVFSKHGDIEEYLQTAYGEEFGRYRRLWKSWESREDAGGREDPAAPVHLLLNLTDACDMKCPTCYRQFRQDKNPKTQLDLPLLRDLLDEAAAMEILSLSLTGGEPMIHPDIVEILDHAGGKNFLEVLVYTNGSQLDEKRRQAILRLAGNTRVRLHISLDAATEATFRSERGGDLARVLANIDAFLEERERLPGKDRPLLWVTFLLKDANREEAGMFLETWKDKADIVQFQRMLKPNAGKVGDSDPGETIAADATPMETYCASPLRTMRVFHNRRIDACCSLYNSHCSCGYFPDLSLSAAWNSPEFTRLREEMRRGTPSPVCRNCLVWMEG